MLRRLGAVFEVRPVDIDESPHAGESATQYVLRLAEEKARAAANSGELILAADTTVVLEDQLLGKPIDPGDAARMLECLSGRWHRVITGVALYDIDHAVSVAASESTRVRMKRLTAAEIEWYVDTEEPLDKAGAYAIQGLGSLFIDEITGNYSNVVGLPLPLLYRLLRWMGWAGLGPAKGLGSVAEFDGVAQGLE